MESVKASAKPAVKASKADIAYIRRELQKFGLSAKQADIYLLLVTHKELRIQEIADIAKIPRSTVYENLRALFELGIAEEVIEDSYRSIRPYPIGVMRHGIDEKMVHLEKLRTDLNKLESAIDIDDPPADINSSARLRFYTDRSGARQLYWNSLKATDTVYVMSDWGRSRYIGIKFYERFVEESKARNIKERVLININRDTLNSIKKYNVPGHPQFRTRVQDIRTIEKSRLVIKGDTLIYNNVYAQVYLRDIRIHGFEVESRNFVNAQRSMYELLWSLARPVSEFLV